MSFDMIPELLAKIHEEQQQTNELMTRFIEAVAGLRQRHDAAKAEAGQVIADAQAAAQAAAPSINAEPVVAENTGSPAAPDAPSVKASASASTPSEAAGGANPTTYEDVVKAVMALANAPGKGRPAVLMVLDKFGAKTGKDLVPDQYAAAVAALNEAAGA